MTEATLEQELSTPEALQDKMREMALKDILTQKQRTTLQMLMRQEPVTIANETPALKELVELDLAYQGKDGKHRVRWSSLAPPQTRRRSTPPLEGRE